MNFVDAMKKVKAGMWVRRKKWIKEDDELHAGYDDGGMFFRSGVLGTASVTFGDCFELEDYLASDWEVFEV